MILIILGIAQPLFWYGESAYCWPTNVQYYMWLFLDSQWLCKFFERLVAVENKYGVKTFQ